MIHIVLVSATPFEIEPTLHFLSSFKPARITVTPCITGVGMVNTAFELGRLAGQKFDMAINAGIAGSFGAFKKGEVVSVTHDRFAELGAEDDEEFLDIRALGFGKQEANIQQVLSNGFTEQLPKTRGITVNTAHGNAASIQKIVTRCNPGVETMEGAAFIHAANAFGWEALQLRAISNTVEKRNKDNWDIPLAIQNLNTTLTNLLNYLDEH